MKSLLTSKISSVFATLTAAATLALGTSGCLVSGSASLDPDVIYVDDTTTIVDTSVARVSIDPGATMAVDPGAGVGLFVQYDSGGHWTVYTTCDTDFSGAGCDFDVLVYPTDSRAFIDNVEGFDLSSEDSITLGNDNSVNLMTTTTFGMDGMFFDADPGAEIEIDVLIDGVAQPQFVFAVSDGRLMDGMPTNPVDFTPAAP